MTELRAAKDALRAQMKAARATIAESARREAEQAAAERLIAFAVVARASCIAAYVSLPDELGTSPLIERAFAHGLTLALPRIVRGQRRLELAQLVDPTALVAGAFGILEPAPSAPRIELPQVDVFVVPGLAFDREGRRLGWGKGHYDATHAARPGPWWVGYAYDLQVVDRVPDEPHDRRMDAICTELRYIDATSAHAPIAAS